MRATISRAPSPAGERSPLENEHRGAGKERRGGVDQGREDLALRLATRDRVDRVSEDLQLGRPAGGTPFARREREAHRLARCGEHLLERVAKPVDPVAQDAVRLGFDPFPEVGAHQAVRYHGNSIQSIAGDVNCGWQH